jgi:hypothetical protein
MPATYVNKHKRIKLLSLLDGPVNVKKDSSGYKVRHYISFCVSAENYSMTNM